MSTSLEVRQRLCSTRYKRVFFAMNVIARDFDKLDDFCSQARLLYKERIDDQVSELFIALAKDSGLHYQVDYASFIDMTNLREPLRTELKQLFQLSDDTKQLKKEEFVRGIRDMTNSFVTRSDKIQRIANQLARKFIRDISSALEERETDPSTPRHAAAIDDYAEELRPREPSISGGMALFRSDSTGIDEFASKHRDYFTPEEATSQLLTDSFQDLFTEKEGNESPPITAASEELVFKYGDLYHFFASEDGVIRRNVFESRIHRFAEQNIVNNPECYNSAAEYCRHKVARARTRLADLIAAQPSIFDFPVGSKVLFKPFSYPEPVPATVTSVTENAYGYKTWKVTLDFDPLGDTHDAYRASLQPNLTDSQTAQVQINNPTAPTEEEKAYQAALWTRHEWEVLQVLRHKLSPSYRISGADDGGLPTLGGSGYYFWFQTPKRVEFHFNQFDYGVKFSVPGNPNRNFLPESWFEGGAFTPARMAASQCVNEINRCFFLHLGRALKINPFALCVAYRIFARRVIEQSAEGDLCRDGANDVLAENRFVDAMALASIWPEELDDYQILVVNLNGDGSFNQHQGFTYIRPPNSRCINERGEFTGRNIVLTLQGGHFTYLEPTEIKIKQFEGESKEAFSERSAAETEDYLRNPIDTLIRYATIINIPPGNVFDWFPDPFGTGQPRMSIRSVLEEFLATEPPVPPPSPATVAVAAVQQVEQCINLTITSNVVNIPNNNNIDAMEVEDTPCRPQTPSPISPPPQYQNQQKVADAVYQVGDAVTTEWGGDAVIHQRNDDNTYSVRYINSNGDIDTYLPASALAPRATASMMARTSATVG